VTTTAPARMRQGIAEIRSHWRTAYWLPLLAVVPLIYPDAYFLHVMIVAMFMGTLASSWNLMLGYAGIFSFGHQAFFGLGAYVSALLAMHVGLSPWLGLVVAGATAAVVSLVIAVPVLRLKAAPYVAIATLGFAEICRITAMNLVDITRGELGLWGIPELFHGAGRIPYYYTILVILALVLFAMDWIAKSPLGLALRSVRESEDAAETLGVDVARTKILAFGISSFMAGVVGAFYAHYLLILTPSSVLSVTVMVEIVTITLLGGLGTLIGPVLAAFGITLGLEYMRWLGDYRLLLYGAGLVLMIIFMPEGLLPRLRHWLRRRAPEVRPATEPST
jgi:branched-chain amino acid transport system permease protein